MSESLKSLLLNLDSSKERLNETTISGGINKVTQNDNSLEAKAERIAFAFDENCENRGYGWGTYYGPLMTWVGEDGKTYENPSLSQIDNDILEYWHTRHTNSKNYIMKARYSGLLWDFTDKVSGKKADYSIAKDYINSLLHICDNDLYEHPIDAIEKITRAYKLSASLNNKDLKKSVIESAINLEGRISEDESPGLWGFCFEHFILGKEKDITEQQKNQLIIELEERLSRVCKSESPWTCESAGIPLATYYRSRNQPEDVLRVIDTVGQSFESACEKADPMLASAWLQHAHEIYINFNLKENAEEVSKKILEVGKGVIDNMQSFSHSVEIPKDELDACKEAMVEGGLEKAITRIAVHFIPNKEGVKEEVLKLAKIAPLSFLISKDIHDHRGRPIAKIGGIQEDLEGNIIFQLSKNMEFSSFFLRHSFIKLFEQYSPSANDICEIIFSSPVFEGDKKELIEKGVQEFLNEDYTNAIHILIPQLEAAVRTLVEFSGGATLRKNRQGGLQLRVFDDLLRDDIVVKCLGNDMSYYFRVLLTDQRAWNLRNDVCHGICSSNKFNYVTADRVVHLLLCLSLIRNAEN